MTPDDFRHVLAPGLLVHHQHGHAVTDHSSAILSGLPQVPAWSWLIFAVVVAWIVFGGRSRSRDQG